MIADLRFDGVGSIFVMVTHCPLLPLVLASALAGACSRSSPPASDSGEVRPSSAALEPDSAAAKAKRAELVSTMERSGYVKDTRVLDVMRRVPRHLFMPEASIEEAYFDAPFPIGHQQTISQPSLVASMTEALEVRDTDTVLEIGTGSGYQAAILSLLAREVYSIEIVRELGENADRRLHDLGYANVHVRVGDGYAGWPEKAPFQRIILTAAPPELPRALVDQLAEGGVMIAPIGETHEGQSLVRVRKKDGKITREPLEAVRFVPMVKGSPR